MLQSSEKRAAWPDYSSANEQETTASTNVFFHRHIYREKLKRVLDIALAVGGLAFFLPLIGLLVLVIRLDGGPAFFVHWRIGHKGREFGCIKFRSMVVDADRALSDYLSRNENAQEEWETTRKLREDPRITRLGKFLRKSSIDEIPQLWNVLIGDMSIVGPRPIVQAELPKYGNEVATYYSVRPGITGLWQVSGRNDTTYEARVKLDAEYASTLSFQRDAEIIGKTCLVVLRRNGAY
jgi:exopolysaccharide production protein ExoY